MFTSDVIALLGSKEAVAEKLGISREAVQQWKAIVPPASAIQLANLYPRKLKIDASLYRKWPAQNRLASGSS